MPSSIFLLLFLTAIFFLSLYLIHRLLKFFTLFLHLDLLQNKPKNPDLTITNNQEFSQQNLFFQEKNDIEKAIFKNNQILDISSIPEPFAKPSKNPSIDEINKKIVKIMKEFFKENSNKLNSSNDALNIKKNGNKSESQVLWSLLKYKVRLNNCAFSLWDDYRSNSGLRKPLMWMNSFHFIMNLLVHIIFLAYFSDDLNKMVEIIGVIPLITFLPLIFINKISKKMLDYRILEQNAHSFHDYFCFIVNFVIINLFFVLLIISAFFIDKYETSDRVWMLIFPSILIDFIILKNILLFIFYSVYCFCLKWAFSQNFEQQIEKEIDEIEEIEKGFLKMIKEITGNEDVSGPSVIISENLSKVLNFIQNASELPQIHERCQM